MNLDELTLGQIKQLEGLLGSTAIERSHRHLGKKVIIRTYSAGVHYGLLVEKVGKECILEDAIRIWHWSGANSLSQLAKDGTEKPDSCKFAVPIKDITLEWIEILPCTDEAQKSIEGAATWKK